MSDIFICGTCSVQFTNLKLFLHHKEQKLCGIINASIENVVTSNNLITGTQMKVCKGELFTTDGSNPTKCVDSVADDHTSDDGSAAYFTDEANVSSISKQHPTEAASPAVTSLLPSVSSMLF